MYKAAAPTELGVCVIVTKIPTPEGNERRRQKKKKKKEKDFLALKTYKSSFSSSTMTIRLSFNLNRINHLKLFL